MKKNDNIQTTHALDKINSLQPYQKAKLKQHFEYLLSNLGGRVINGLRKISVTLNPDEIIEQVFSESFNFKNIQFIGVKCVEDLEKFKLELIKFIEGLQTIENETLNNEYSKLSALLTYVNLPDNFEEHFEKVFNEDGKIRLFTLIKLLIDSGKVFSKTQNKLFTFLYTNEDKQVNTLDLLEKELNCTNERVRQIKIKFEKNILSSFMFIANFVSDDLINYGVENSYILNLIDDTLTRRIIESEDVNFNNKFYCLIFGILLKHTHSVLGYNDIISIDRKYKNKRKYQNYYLINSDLFNQFDFKTFIKDVFNKINKGKGESYSLNLKHYLYKPVDSGEKVNLKEIQSICETIIFSEFKLVLIFDRYLLYNQNSEKILQQYFYEILEKNGVIMTIKEIIKAAQLKYPYLKINESLTRKILNREKLHFISLGRSSHFGLQKWENEKENIKGGTIRNLVEEYLLNEASPKHMAEVTSYIKQYRPNTYRRSILDNLKVDNKKRFKFFKNRLVGLVDKEYPRIFIELKPEDKPKIKSWKVKFEELKIFRERNKDKWPSASSTDENEKVLYRFGYAICKLYQNGKLSKEKELLFNSIDFPINRNISRAKDWNIEAKKLIEFINSEKRLARSNSPNKEERSLYTFFNSNKKAYQNDQLSKEKIKTLKKMNFNFRYFK